jgi:hypothetical protein
LRAAVRGVKNGAKLDLSTADAPEQAFAPVAAHPEIAKLLAEVKGE